jgi:ABC-type phosphate/phosphonate transport system permease subunit
MLPPSPLPRTFAAAVTALVVAFAAITIASVVVAVTAIAAATLLGRVRGVLLVRGVLRLIRALEPGALDGPDLGPHLCGEPLGVV